MTSHYVYLVAATQLVAGILLLTNRYVVLALALLARDREHRNLSPDNATGDGAAGDSGDAPLDLFVLVVSGALCMSLGPEGECLSRNLMRHLRREYLRVNVEAGDLYEGHDAAW